MISSDKPFSDTEFARILEEVLSVADEHGVLWQELLLFAIVSLFVLGILGVFASGRKLSDEEYRGKAIWIPFGVFLCGMCLVALLSWPYGQSYLDVIQIVGFSIVMLILGGLRLRFGWLTGCRFLDLQRPRVFLVFAMIPVVGTVLGWGGYYSVLRIRMAEEVKES